MRKALWRGKIMGALMILLILFLPAGVAEEEKTDVTGQWKYVLEEGGATLTGYTAEMLTGDLAVPGELDGHTVTRIGAGAFEEGSLTGVSIPQSVVSIGDGAFRYCFGLTSLTIPGNVASIGDSAFLGCTGLADVVLSEGVASIGSRAFYAACIHMASVTIPASATELGESLFGPMAGDEYALAFIDVSPGNPRYEQRDGVLFDKRDSALALYPAARQGAYVVPEGVLRINDGAFDNCWGLTDVTIPEGVTAIGDRAFEGCESLSEVRIPDSVTNLGDSAFCGCTGLTGVTLPAGVTRIGEMAFAWCGLTGLTLPEGVTSIGSGAFYLCSDLGQLTVPASVTEIADDAFVDCDELTLSVTQGSFAEEYAKKNGIAYVIAGK